MDFHESNRFCEFFLRSISGGFKRYAFQKQTCHFLCILQGPIAHEINIDFAPEFPFGHTSCKTFLSHLLLCKIAQL